MRKGQRVSIEGRANMRIAALNRPRHTHSVATRAKIGSANTGRPVSIETRAKIGAANRGHMVSPETRIKLSIAHMGHHPSIETRIKMSAIQMNGESRKKKSLAMSGEKSVHWKGGVIKTSDKYEKIRIHSRFYILAHRVQMAQILGRPLRADEVVHHINHRRTDNRPTNLALCSDRTAHRWCDSEEAKVFLGQGDVFAPVPGVE